MNKLLMGFIVVGLFIGLFYLGYNLGNKNNTSIESQEETIQEIAEENSPAPAVDYTISQTLQERELKMQGIDAIVQQKYSSQDQTTQKIIGLCLAGNTGSCSLLQSNYNIIVGEGI